MPCTIPTTLTCCSRAMSARAQECESSQKRTEARAGLDCRGRDSAVLVPRRGHDGTRRLFTRTGAYRQVGKVWHRRRDSLERRRGCQDVGLGRQSPYSCLRMIAVTLRSAIPARLGDCARIDSKRAIDTEGPHPPPSQCPHAGEVHGRLLPLWPKTLWQTLCQKSRTILLAG
jgi:hypothetical protein